MNKVEQLEKLQGLREKGVLSGAEFEIEKHKILNDNPTQSQKVVQQQPQPPQKKANGFGIAGFILSLLGGFNWHLTLPFGLIALILSIVGLSMSSKKYKKGLATAGLIISIIITIVGIVYYIHLMGQQSKYGRINMYD